MSVDVGALRALCDAATPGPWEATGCLVEADPHHVGRCVIDRDARYIAAACNALPELLDLLDQAVGLLRGIERGLVEHDEITAFLASYDRKAQ